MPPSSFTKVYSIGNALVDEFIRDVNKFEALVSFFKLAVEPKCADRKVGLLDYYKNCFTSADAMEAIKIEAAKCS